MKLIYTLIIISSIYYSQLNASTLSSEQRKYITKCYKSGLPHDLANTLAGICYVESKGGLYKVNPLSGDYGLTQIHIKTALTRLKLNNTWHNRNKVATLLVTDDSLALALAIAELLYWRDTRSRTDWYHMVSSYNQGTIITSPNYAQAVANAIKYLKQQRIIP